tara:strand:+ start:1176 stop:2264 length:1089 start_codon:yes stop_codon:yes gene_type:complete
MDLENIEKEFSGHSKVFIALKEIFLRHQEINTLLEDPKTYEDHKLSEKLNKERAELDRPAKHFKEYAELVETIINTKNIIDNESDEDIKQLAKDEILKDQELKQKLEIILTDLITKTDPNDSRDIFLEIRAGTGGDEAAIFAGDLYRMYTKFTEKNSWSSEIISLTEGDHGGYKEIIIKITGSNVYGEMKFESGTHRVQRVPETETQGRVHTSAATIAVLPVVQTIDEVQINNNDLRIDTYRASGAGGQHVNKTDSAVRITHLPTGTVAECQDGRSQHKNKSQALEILYSKLLVQEQDQQKRETAEERKSLVGSGDRSERIRTYNFPQGRVTDHRINLTLYKLEQILEGNIEPVVDELKKSL